MTAPPSRRTTPAGGALTPTAPPAKVPTPRQIREEFEDLVVKDLLGPAGGDHEQLAGDERVRNRYLVGMLAPRGTVAHDRERDDPAAVEAGGEPEAGRAADAGAAVPTLFPSSLGLTCSVAGDATKLHVTGRWGWYRKEKIEAAEGERGTVWQRYPMVASVDVPLTEGAIAPRPLSKDQPGVVVRGEVRKLNACRVVTLFLVNAQATPPLNKDEAWLFQASLVVEHPEGAAVFVGRAEAAPGAAAGLGDSDADHLDMLYRGTVEFATGHGTAVHAVVSPQDVTRAVRIETTAMPEYEVPRTEAPTAADFPELADVVLDMRALADLEGEALVAALTPLADAYDGWLEREAKRISDPAARLGGHHDTATAAIKTAQRAAARLRAGIALLGTDPVAVEAFRFANRAMWHQRVRSTAIEMRRRAPDEPFDELLAKADKPENRSWRPFQLAFVCLNLPSLTDPTHDERARPGLVDLLFFPTGGGKTEAYLGLTAYTFAIRRLQGDVAGYDGMNGVAVLMRYTLRLLTADQFKRAASLVCACEMLRRQEAAAGNSRLGDTPFRIGLWVGQSVTPNKSVDARRNIDAARGNGGRRGSRASSPVQLVACPWCGTALSAARDAKTDGGRWRTLLYCGDTFGTCEFTANNNPDDGIPVVTVDEEIYRLLPSLLIATADKFAQLPWQGPVGMLFGRVTGRCERHGFRCVDLDATKEHEEANSHPAKNGLPAAKTVPWGPIRPPDLIIQDELHLIAGPLGSMAGLYETAVDRLASWTVDGKTVRPKVIASTATVRRAREQAYALFWRDLAVFPPPVLDVENSFFAVQRPVSDAAPGRRYRGICAPGVRLKAVEIRVFVTLLAAAKLLHENYGVLADPYMTLVGYFNALRELGGMRRLLDDDVSARLRKMRKRGLANRLWLEVQELTSRISSDKIPTVLSQLRVRHEAEKPKKGEERPIDVLLATNMISVGVDVGRLGLMVAVGQPKATAEYIQATSRVGRERPAPGVVFTIYNWSRPRDLSHYERFEHYHATFYKQVEALSVTPFAARALDRGLTALLAALLRQGNLKWNPNTSAHSIPTADAALDEILADVATRAGEVTASPKTAADVLADLRMRLDRWAGEQRIPGRLLGYRGDGKTVYGLLQNAGGAPWDVWTVPNSLRETEPSINLVMTTYDDSALNGPAFVFGGAPAGAAGGPPTDEDLTDEEAAAAVSAAEAQA